MRRLYLVCAFVIAVTPVAMLAQSVPAAAEAALLAAEDTRFHAELTHDATTLDRMTAADVVYSHVNGAREDKAALMQTFTHLPFSSITPFGRHEPRRVCRRLQLLRRWSLYEQDNEQICA